MVSLNYLKAAEEEKKLQKAQRHGHERNDWTKVNTHSKKNSNRNRGRR